MGTAPIVDLRANVKADVSTCSEPKSATGFSYILNDLRLTCGRPARSHTNKLSLSVATAPAVTEAFGLPSARRVQPEPV